MELLDFLLLYNHQLPRRQNILLNLQDLVFHYNHQNLFELQMNHLHQFHHYLQILFYK